MSIEKQYAILAHKLAKYLKENEAALSNIITYRDKYEKYNPVIKKDGVLYPVEFFEGRLIKEFLREQEEYSEGIDWKYITEKSLTLLGV